MKGQIHVYTGNGKGKTTAALGVALRAAGAGKRVFIAQFVKSMEYHEIAAIHRYLSQLVEVRLYGTGCFINREPSQADIDCAIRGIEETERILASGNFDVAILDEANIATYFRLFSPQRLIRAINKRAPGMEIIVTGRYASQELLEVADLITDMTEVRHYYTNGIPSRPGIDH